MYNIYYLLYNISIMERISYNLYCCETLSKRYYFAKYPI